MKYEQIVLLTLAIVLLGFINGITGKTITKVVTKCPRPCECAPTYKPVCDTTGKTHSNACLAKCFGATVKTQGPCPIKNCSTKENIVKTHNCRIAVYGKTGRRKHCCTKLVQGKKVLQKTCNWIGCVHKRKIVKKCSYVKVSKYVKALKCCKWVVKSCGKKHTNSPVKCVLGKHRYYKKKVYGCKPAPFGKCGKRTLCCYHHRVCTNKKCKKVGRKCHYRGGWTNVYKKEKCTWKQRNSYTKQRKCCNTRRVCKFHANGKKIGCSKVKSSHCKWTGKKIISAKRTRCQWRKFGRFGKRKRCCSYHKHCCKKTKKCSNVNVVCNWKGAAIYTQVKTKCSIKGTKAKGCKRNFCCSWVRRCVHGKCHNLRKKCSYRGRTVCVRRKRLCNWKKTCKTGVRMYCCHHTSKYNGAKWNHAKQCKWSGKTIYTKYKTKCSWHVLKKHKKYQRKCCQFKQICKGKLHCKTVKGKCRYIGKVISYKYSRHCHVRKQSKFAKQKVCCSYVHKCAGKAKKCKLYKRKCVKKGSIVYNIPKSKCIRRKYPGRGCTRARCCKWTRYCLGSKCRPINKKCKWSGPITRSYVTTSCHWKCSKNKTTKRRRCCYFRNKCVGKDCRRKKIRCSYTGHVVKTTHHNKCYWKTRGKYIRQKYCCRHTKVVKGGKTAIKNKKCGFVGIRYYRRNFYKCQHKISCKKSLKLRKRCCAYIKSCKGKKCVVHNKGCKWTGPAHKIHHSTVCNWRQYGKAHKKQYCCYYSRKCTYTTKGGVTKKKCVALKRKCQYKGKAIQLRVSYWKKKSYCKNTKTHKKCCQKLYLCSKFGKKFVCKLRNSNYKCKYTKLVKRSLICVSSGDPHYTTFEKRKFNFQGRGDYVLLRTSGLTVHTRQQTWSKSTSVNTAVAVRISRKTILESVSRSGATWLVNKKKVIHLKVGKQVNFATGGSIKLAKRGRVYIYSKNRDFIDAMFHKRSTKGYINIIIKVSKTAKNAYGLCASKNFARRGRGLFFKYYKGGKISKPSKCTGAKRVNASKRCAKLGVCKADMNECILDVCHGLPATQEKEVEKELVKLRRKPFQCRNVHQRYDKVAKYFTAKQLRARALRRCKHKNKFVFYSCVFDSARGFHKTKQEYANAAKYMNAINKGSKKCYSSGDPHILTFAGRGFNVYNVQQSKRLIYQHGGLTVRASVKYNRNWGTRGINSHVFITSNGKTWNVAVGNGKSFNKCGGTLGGAMKRTYKSTSRTYVYVHNKKTIVTVIVNVRGYINVYVTAPTGNTMNCRGDCCEKPKAHPHVAKGLTFKYGNPYTVRFHSACSRKAKYAASCAKTYRRSFKATCACIRKYAQRN